MLNPHIETSRIVGAAYGQFKAKRVAQAAALGVALLAGTSATTLAAPTTLPACVSIPGATTVVSLVTDASGQLSLPCTPQPGQQLVIIGRDTQAALNPAALQAPDDHLGTMADVRADTYAKRQAIRDKYRGQINETTFNDELADGVSLDLALADAMAELGKPR